jgi:RNA polymerase sigma-70 factor (ECF subfamily)
MTDSDQHWSSWVRRLADGEEAVVVEFWRDYGGRLEALAAGYLSSRMRRREGPEDVVQSVCRTFLRRNREGQFELAGPDSLWRLLCAITLAKVREKVRFHGREKRKIDRERYLDDSRASDSPLVSHEPTPAEAAEFADQMQRLFHGMDDEERQVVTMKLEQYTHPEIADRLGCSERTVRRIVKRVQEHLKRVLEESL